MQVKKQQLELDMEQQTGSKSGKEYVKAVYYHPDYLTFNFVLGYSRELKWALGSITMNKASGSNGIPVELFQILKDDAVKVLHSISQHIWKTQ